MKWDLGISKYFPAFDMTAIDLDLKSFEAIELRLKKLAELRLNASLDALHGLALDGFDVDLPKDLELPDIRPIPSPKPVQRMDLELRKRKTWKGIDEGDPAKFNVYANAWVEVRGSEIEQETTAEAKAGPLK